MVLAFQVLPMRALLLVRTADKTQFLHESDEPVGKIEEINGVKTYVALPTTEYVRLFPIRSHVLTSDL